MSQLYEYIINNKVNHKRLKSEISDEREQKLPKRNAFVLLRKYAEDFFQEGKQPRMVALSGLRGVGKTTLMWQTADYVYGKHSKNIYFISIDDLNRIESNLYDVINTLEKQIFNCSLNELDEKIMLLIDEVHEASDWQKDLKILYERGKKIFILTTGSSALLLHSSSDLASRWTLMKIFPFRFTEFLLAKSWLKNPKNLVFSEKGLAKNLRNAFFYSADYNEIKSKIEINKAIINRYLNNVETKIEIKITELLDEYISYHNIARFISISNNIQIIERILALFDRILSNDIKSDSHQLYNIINRMLLRIALSDEINFQKLSKDFRIKEIEVENIISILDNAEILNVFLPQGGIRSKTGMSKKVFFMSPSLRRALYSRIYGDRLSIELRAKLYEDITAMYLKKNLSVGIISFSYGRKKNPDFVIETMDNPVLIEIGVSKTTKSQIQSYNNYRYGLLINSKIKQPQFDDTHKIISLPLSWFLLI